MTTGPNIASSILVSLHPPLQGGGEPRMLGRTLAERQVEFAAACGCAEVVALGPGGSGQAVALRHLAERLGMRFREASGPHALARAGLAGERLLVLHPRLLPDPAAWPDHPAADRGLVLTLPAAGGTAAGFERIDLARAWGGALVLPGALLPRLLDLPDDAEASSALLRIGLQAGLPDAAIDPAALDDGRWTLVDDGTAMAAAERAWLHRHLQPEAAAPLSKRLALAFLKHAGGRMLEKRAMRPVVLALGIALLPGAAALCHWDRDVAGFLLLALAAPVMETGFALGRLHLAREGAFTRADRLAPLRCLIDGALALCGAVAIEGDPLEQAFAPLVLLAALHGGFARQRGTWSVLRDRGLVALIVAGGALLHSAQAGVMAAALALMALNIAQLRGTRRITQA